MTEMSQFKDIGDFPPSIHHRLHLPFPTFFLFIGRRNRQEHVLITVSDWQMPWILQRLLLLLIMRWWWVRTLQFSPSFLLTFIEILVISLLLCIRLELLYYIILSRRCISFLFILVFMKVLRFFVMIKIAIAVILTTAITKCVTLLLSPMKSVVIMNNRIFVRFVVDVGSLSIILEICYLVVVLTPRL